VAQVEDVDASHFEWLAPMDNEVLVQGTTVRIVYFNVSTCAPEGGHGHDGGALERQQRAHSGPPNLVPPSPLPLAV
jgi:hypothetical protein